MFSLARRIFSSSAPNGTIKDEENDELPSQELAGKMAAPLHEGEAADGVLAGEQELSPAVEKKSKKSKKKVKKSWRNTLDAADAEETLDPPGDKMQVDSPTYNGASNTSNTGLAEATIAESQPKKKKKKRKSSGQDQTVTKRQTRAASAALTLDGPNGETESTEVSMRLSKQKAKTPKIKKLKQTEVVMEEDEIDIPTDPVSALADKISGPLSGETKKSKKKSKRSSEQLLATEEGAEASAAHLRKSLTPATSHEENPLTSEVDALGTSGSQIALDGHDVDVDTPKRPSKNALGKRIAQPEKSNKKRRRSSDKADGTPSLTSFGFMPSSAKKDTRDEILQSSPWASSKDEDKAARSSKSDMRSSSHPISTSILPPAVQDIRSSARRPTPAFTPINRRVPLAPVSQEEKPVHTQDSDDESEFQPEKSPEEKPEMLQEPPQSSGRKKRRLPTGEPQSSSVRALSRTPRKDNGFPQNPKGMSATPGPRGHPIAKNSKLSIEEIEAISSAFEQFREQNNLTQMEVNSMIQKGVKEHRDILNHVCEQVPSVPRIRALKFCRRNFHNFEARGSWTAEQDEDLRELCLAHPGKWKTIGETLNRFSEDCRDRWRNYLVCGENLRKDYWEHEEEEKLTRVVQRLIAKIRADKNLEHNSLINEESLLDWMKVSEEMGYTRSRLQCINKWKSLKEKLDDQLEDPIFTLAPITETKWRLQNAEKQASEFTAAEKLRILYAIRDSQAGKESKIPWQALSRKELKDMKGKRMGMKVCFRSLKSYIPEHDSTKLQVVVEQLIDAFETAAPAEPVGFDHRVLYRTKSSLGKRKYTYKPPKSSTRVGSEDDEDLDEELDDREDDEEEEEEKNEEIVQMEASKPKKRKLDLGTSLDVNRETHTKKSRKSKTKPRNVDESDPSPKKKKKRNQRMRQEDEDVSQETNDQAADDEIVNAEALLESMQALKNGRTNTSRVRRKSPIAKVMTTQGNGHSSFSGSSHEAEPEPSEEEVVSAVVEEEMEIEREGTFTSPGGPEAKEDEEMEDSDALISNDQVSIDLDADRTITTNGFHDEIEPEYEDEDDLIANGFHDDVNTQAMAIDVVQDVEDNDDGESLDKESFDEESEAGEEDGSEVIWDNDVESVDLDTPVEPRRHDNRLHSPFSYMERASQGQVDEDDDSGSDVSSIPPVAKKGRRVGRESSSDV